MQQLLRLPIPSQILEIKNRLFLIDCGEDTIKQLRKKQNDFLKSTIFFIFAFARHFGLIGLVSTFTLLNRNTDLHIYGPKGIKEIIKLQFD
jgi:ribonuclease Z